LSKQKRLIVGISGATGAVYGVRMLEILAKIEDIETHLVLTKAGKMTIQVETPYSVKDVEAMADVVHDVNNVGASISSGSFRTEGMVIAPCSMKSMGGIAHSLGGDLLVRAADVVLKERKKTHSRGARDATSFGPSGGDGRIDKDGRGDLSASAGFLPSTEDPG
jgi:4-hydroxy-3-polyprenylbenzoate decarboxylase